jgi:2,4-dienoyl-CoA reductase-like NADH-dependent reductase (Old Yellow Enzyme family)
VATLTDQIAIGPALMRNRVMHLAVNTGYAEQHQVSERLYRYWRSRAEGGAGAIVSGLTPVHPSSVYKHSVLKNTGEEDLPALARFAEAVGEPGALSVLQLVHNGAQLVAGPGAAPPVSPSGRPVPGLAQPSVALTGGEIAGLVESFAAAADRARRVGIAGVEVHGAHGFLIHQFLSPLTNVRADRYGGSAGNRLRFALEILDAVRQRVGDGLVVGFRLAGSELTAGGITEEDAISTARELCDRGLVDYLSVSAGNYGTLEYGISPWTFPAAPLAGLCGRIRAVATVPVVVANRITTPEQASAVLAAGQADIVGLGRALLADPEWPRRARNGGRVRPCITANTCFAGGGVTTSAGIECAVNPALAAGRESVGRSAVGRSAVGRSAAGLSAIAPSAVGPSDGAGKPLVVIGAGVAGLTFAVEATRRGHRVRVLERTARPGGQLACYDRALTGGRFGAYVTWAVAELAEAGVGIEFGHDVSGQELARLTQNGAGAVVVASGAVPGPATASGYGRIPVRTSASVIADPPSAGRVLVSAQDSGDEPLQVAHYLAGLGLDVLLVTPLESPAPRMEALTRRSLLARFGDAGGRVETGTAIEQAGDGSLRLRRPSGAAGPVAGDVGLVVSCGGRIPQRPADGRHDPAYSAPIRYIGDCVTPADIASATRQAYQAAHELCGGGEEHSGS